MIHVSEVETSFNCPICTCPHTEDDWYDKYSKSDSCVIYKNCKGCKRKLGITTDFDGVVVWDKRDENNA